MTSHLANKITLSSENLLQPPTEPAAGLIEVLPGEVAEDLLDGGNQGLLGVVGDLLVSCSATPHTK